MEPDLSVYGARQAPKDQLYNFKTSNEALMGIISKGKQGFISKLPGHCIAISSPVNNGPERREARNGSRHEEGERRARRQFAFDFDIGCCFKACSQIGRDHAARSSAVERHTKGVQVTR